MSLPADVLSEQQLLNYVDIAVREHLPGLHEAARVTLREAMRRSGCSDPIEAASFVLKAMEAEKGSVQVKDRALLYAAAVHIRNEGREGREEVATQDRPAADPTKKGKGKGKKDGKARHKPAKASASWVKALGKDVLILEVTSPLSEEALLEALQKGAGPKGPHIGKAPRLGWCQIRDLLDVEFPVLPRVLLESGTLIWGLRLDEKKGLPTARLRAEARALARQRASEDGTKSPTREEIDNCYDQLAEKWYAAATPTSTVVPITYDMDTNRILIHTKSAKLQDEARKALGAVRRRQAPELWAELDRRDLAATDLRRENGLAESGRAILARDLLLWICARTAGGTGVLDLGDGTGERLEFWIDDKVKLSRQVPDQKAMKIELGKAPTEGGSLFAALADGAQPTSMRVTIRAREREFHATIEGGEAVAFGLPCETKPSSEADITASLLERILLHDEADRLVQRVIGAFLADRASGWGQRMNAFRGKLGLEMAKRYAFDSETGQGFLFAHMLPGQQTVLGQAMAEAEQISRSSPRGRREHAAN